MDVRLAAAGRTSRDWNSSSIDMSLSSFFFFWVSLKEWLHLSKALKWKRLIKLEADRVIIRDRRQREANNEFLWNAESYCVASFVLLLLTVRHSEHMFHVAIVMAAFSDTFLFSFFRSLVAQDAEKSACRNVRIRTTRRENSVWIFAFRYADRLAVCVATDNNEDRTTSISCYSWRCARGASTLRRRNVEEDFFSIFVRSEPLFLFFSLLLIVSLFASAQYE